MKGVTSVQALPDELSLDAENPWPGLTAFTEKQHEFFFGRDQESDELFRCVKRERITVLFGKSGLGKTSLLQAGLFPQLRADYLPVYIRLSYAEEAAPFDSQLRMALEAAIQSANFAEVALPQAGESMWEYLHRRGGNLINDAGNTVMPVLVFDQFEECFTLGARKTFASRLSGEFLPGLAELIENRTPASLTRKLTEDRDLAKRYDLEGPGCRMLIALREDYLANLEALRDSMPSLVFVDNRMRLTEMTGEQALSVVADPSPNLVAGDVAESIVRFVAGAHADSPDGEKRPEDVLPLEQLEVAPAILSLFCRELNEERLKPPVMPRITQALVTVQGVTIIDDFYKKCIVDMPPAVRRLIEDHLLTTAGYRDNIDLGQARADLEQAGVRSSCLDDLVKLRLLQVEDHRGNPRLELTHDVLADPVKRSRDQWNLEQAEKKSQQQEREALIQAKKAERAAVERAHFLQKIVAGTAFVSLLLAALLVYGLFETRKAKRLQDQSDRNREQSELYARTANANAATARDNESKANANAAMADKMADQDKKDVKKANDNAAEALANANRAEMKQAELADTSSKTLEHCIEIEDVFDAAEETAGDEKKDTLKEVWERILMEDNQCLTVAQQLHKVAPTNIEITDPLTNIPLKAALSAIDRDDRKKANEYFDRAIKLVDSLSSEPKSDSVEILVARTYMGTAAVLFAEGDESAQAKAEHGMKIITSLRARRPKNDFVERDWNNLSQFYLFDAIFLDTEKKNMEALDAYEESFRDEIQALNGNQKSSFYRRQAINRGISIAKQYEDKLGKSDDALKWYKTSLDLSVRLDDHPKTTEIYTSMRILLVKNKKYDEAHQLFDQRIQSLLVNPSDNQRERDLAKAYAESAEIDEDRKQWDKAVDYRAHEVKVLVALDPKTAYDGFRSELATAYSDLSWAEIFAGKSDSGVADAQKAISLYDDTKRSYELSRIYNNATKALIGNKRYDEADKLLDQNIQSLLAAPLGIDRERSLAKAYGYKAQIVEAKKQWVKGIDFRAGAVKTLAGLKESAYDDLKSDLATAYSDLSWDEILAGQTDAGLADMHKAIKLYEGAKRDSGLSTIYDNATTALLAREKYSEADNVLDEDARSIQTEPPGTDRERSLVKVYARRAEIAEKTQQWSRGIAFRLDVIKTLESLDPKSYDDLKSDLVNAYGSLSWMEERGGRFADGLRDAKTALALDPAKPWIEINEAHGLFFTGQTSDGRAVYLKVKNLPGTEGPAMGKAIGDDFQELCKLGHTRPEMPVLVHDLGIDNPDLNKCLAGIAK